MRSRPGRTPILGEGRSPLRPPPCRRHRSRRYQLTPPLHGIAFGTVGRVGRQHRSGMADAPHETRPLYEPLLAADDTHVVGRAACPDVFPLRRVADRGEVPCSHS